MWKIGAMQKPIELRLKEKDSVISQLNKELQVFILDSKLRFILEFQKNDTVKSLIDTLTQLEAMVEDKQEKLEQRN